MLGPTIASSIEADTFLWDTELDESRFPMLSDHRVRGAVVVPAAVFAEMALEATSRRTGAAALQLLDLQIDEALLLDGTMTREVQVALQPGPPGAWGLRISSRAPGQHDGAWTIHARGLACEQPLADAARAPYAFERPGMPAAADPGAPVPSAAAQAHYAAMQARGLEYGAAFRGVLDVVAGPGSVWGRVELPAGMSAQGFVLHPALLDSILQLAVAAIPDGSATATFVPVAIEALRCAGGGAVPGGWAHAVPREAAASSDGSVVVDVVLLDEAGRSVVEVQGLALKRLEAQRDDLAAGFYDVRWQQRASAAPSGAAAARGAWLVAADRNGDRGTATARALLEQLQALGVAASLAAVDAGGFSAPRVPIAGVVYVAQSAMAATPADGAAPEHSNLRACASVLGIVQALVGAPTQPPPSLVVVTSGAQAALDGEAPTLEHAALWGMLRTLANEHPELRSRIIDVSAEPSAQEVAALALELTTHSADQVALRGTVALLPRLRPITLTAARGAARTSSVAGRAYRAVISTPGILDGLACRPLLRRTPAPGEVEIEVEATGLNFMNVMSALGTYPGYPAGVGPLGIECSGRISAVGSGVAGLEVGTPVLAIALDSLASHVIADARLVRRRPGALTAAEAAAVPIAFATALYALEHLGRLQRGERVLVHAATGGVGLAAIQIARRIGAEVYATAGSAAKRALLASLGVRHVMDSRSLSFRDELLAVTGGEGVDVVLNSLAGEFIPASLAVLKPYGRFVEIGKRDIYRNSPLGLLPFSRNLSYFALDLDKMIRERPERIAVVLDEVLERLAGGDYQPLPVVTTPVSRMSDAFRDMAQGRHTGKLVLTHHDDALRLDAESGALPALVAGTCVITGGLGGLGLAVARWLVEQGATRLALVGRSAANDTQLAAVERLRAAGAQVLVMRCDLSVAAQAGALVADIERDLAPVSCIVHAAGVLDDALLQQQDVARFERAFAPKIAGAWNLDATLAGRSGVTLVLFSSVAALLGLAGQANYAAANSWLDAFAHRRRARGEPTVSIDWAPWSDIGMAAVHADRGARLEDRGLANLSPAAGLAALQSVLASGATQVAVMDFDINAYAATYPAAAHSVLLADLAPGAPPAVAHATPHGIKQALLAAEPGRRRVEAMQAFLKEQVGKVLRQSASRLDADKPFRTLGFDSLMGLELRNRLELETGLTLSATMVWNYPTIAALAQELAARLGVPLAGEPAGEPAGAGAVTVAVDTAADADLEAMLAEIEQLSAEEARQLRARDR
jgi:NADPH:quinone reductase-like Zn-dependent oxidoreductase/NADP-dependent 3-hydroxy acid dehydrogenase YdfG/acyl carrier protein